MGHIVAGPGETSRYVEVGAGEQINVQPTLTGSVYLEYTFSSEDEINSGDGRWKRCTVGLSTTQFAYVATARCFVRIGASGAPASLFVGTASTPLDRLPLGTRRDNLGYIVSEPVDQGASVAELVTRAYSRFAIGTAAMAQGPSAGTYLLVYNAPDHFDGIEVELENDTGSVKYAQLCVAPLDAIANAQNVLSYSARQTVTIPASASGVNGRVAAYFAISSVDATDGGYGPYYAIRLAEMTAASGGAVTTTLRLANTFTAPTHANVSWMTKQVKRAWFASGEDWVTTPNQVFSGASVSANENTPFLIKVTYYLRGRPLRSVVSIGASQGLGILTDAPGKFRYPLAQICNDYRIPYCSEHHNGHPSQQTYNRFLSLYADPNWKPATVFYHMFTTNDGLPTQAIIERQRAYWLDVVDKCERRGIEDIITVTPVPRATSPANTASFYTQAQDDLRKAQCDYIRTTGGGRWKYVDEDELYSDQGSPAKWKYASDTVDGIHKSNSAIDRGIPEYKSVMGL